MTSQEIFGIIGEDVADLGKDGTSTLKRHGTLEVWRAYDLAVLAFDLTRIRGNGSATPGSSADDRELEVGCAESITPTDRVWWREHTGRLRKVGWDPR